MTASSKTPVRAACTYAGWIAFFAPALFLAGFVLSLMRDHYGALMAAVGKFALYLTVVMPLVSIVAALVSLVGAAVYKDQKLRVQGLVGLLGIGVLISVALFSGIATATVMALGASAN